MTLETSYKVGEETYRIAIALLFSNWNAIEPRTLRYFYMRYKQYLLSNIETKHHEGTGMLKA